MYNPVERCDRTAYVSGLHPSVSDIDLFETFNRVAHVEKVIVRNGACRHALVVFKAVQGLYMALVHFQGYQMHGREINIRPLKESSHSSNEMLSNVVQNQNQNQQHRSGSNQDNNRRFHSSFNQNYDNRYPNNRGYSWNNRMNPSNYGRRRSSRNCYPDEHDSRNSGHAYNSQAAHQLYSFNTDHIPFEDYSEGAQRFDNLAKLVRASQPADPFQHLNRSTDHHHARGEPRSRLSSKDSSKNGPPNWKMELKIKKNDEEPLHQPEKMTPNQFFAKCANISGGVANSMNNADFAKKKPPNLSVINPSLFYEQYPRTSSPITSMHSGNRFEKAQSPHDPAVLAYRRMCAPSAFDGLSPIDIQNCSFVTKHLAPAAGVPLHVAPQNQQQLPSQQQQQKRDMTNDELSDMIVSTGNLRINITANPLEPFNDEPAPWSPVKRLRAESGSVSVAQMASPQFSPIHAKSSDFNEIEDEVFASENRLRIPAIGEERANASPAIELQLKTQINKAAPKIANFDDINNSRLPSNSHSANANSEKEQEFVFPDYPMCRHSSVPSITHLVSEMSDIGVGCGVGGGEHVSVGAKYAGIDLSASRDYQSSSNSKSWQTTSSASTSSHLLKQDGAGDAPTQSVIQHEGLMMHGF